jgi:hypothetical protein
VIARQSRAEVLPLRSVHCAPVASEKKREGETPPCRFQETGFSATLAPDGCAVRNLAGS